MVKEYIGQGSAHSDLEIIIVPADQLPNGANQPDATEVIDIPHVSLPLRRNRYRIGRQSYEDLLDIVTRRDITDPWVRVPARIETYFHQAAMGRRPLREILSKTSIYMNWVEKKHPDVYDWLTTKDESGLKPVMQMRNKILPPEMQVAPTRRSPRR